MGAAVEAAAERDERRPAGRDLGELHGGLDGLGARVREEQPVLGPRHRVREAVGQAAMQLQAGLVVDDVLLEVDPARRLLGDGRNDARMGVARVGYPDAAGVIEVALPVGRFDPRPGGSFDDQVRVARPHRRDPGAQRGPVGQKVGGVSIAAHVVASAGLATIDRRWLQYWMPMNTNAIRKMSVPRAFTSGGMPRRLTPNTHRGNVTVRPALNDGDHVVVDGQGEREERGGQDAREDEREGHRARRSCARWRTGPLPRPPASGRSRRGARGPSRPRS